MDEANFHVRITFTPWWGVVMSIALIALFQTAESREALAEGPTAQFSARNPDIVFADEPIGMTSSMGTVQPAAYVSAGGGGSSLFATRAATHSATPAHSAPDSGADSAPRLLSIRSAQPVPELGNSVSPSSDWLNRPDAAQFSATEILGRLVRGTLMVLVLLGIALWGLRFWMKRGVAAMRPNGALRVIDSAALVGRCQLQLVEAEGHRVLVGIDGGSIKCMTVLPGRFDDVLMAAETDEHEAAVILDSNQQTDYRPGLRGMAVGQPA